MERDTIEHEQRPTGRPQPSLAPQDTDLDLTPLEGAALARLLDRLEYCDIQRHAGNRTLGHIMLKGARKVMDALRGAGYYV